MAGKPGMDSGPKGPTKNNQPEQPKPMMQKVKDAITPSQPDYKAQLKDSQSQVKNLEKTIAQKDKQISDIKSTIGKVMDKYTEKK